MGSAIWVASLTMRLRRCPVFIASSIGSRKRQMNASSLCFAATDLVLSCNSAYPYENFLWEIAILLDRIEVGIGRLGIGERIDEGEGWVGTKGVRLGVLARTGIARKGVTLISCCYYIIIGPVL